LNKVIKIGIGGALVPIFLLVIVFLILIGGPDGTGKEPNKESGEDALPTTIINGIGFPYAEGTYVTFTQGFWTNVKDAMPWWGGQIPPYVRGMHPGVDYSAGSGTSILAILPGEVVFTGYNGGFGNHIIIHSVLEGGRDIYVLYGHFSRTLAKVGEHKTLGEVVGEEGSTGLSTGSHVHIEIAENYDHGQFIGTIDYRKLREGGD
jgi:murein DD-endopeptidase MepM/ murein hydrolase activator NlpD